MTAEQVWAANGSNEVITQLLQAFGGPGRTLLSFTPTYSMYPEYARNTHTRYVTQDRGDPTSGSTSTGRRRDRGAATRRGRHRQPQQSDRAPRIDLETIRAICEVTSGIVVIDEAYYEFARSRDA